LKEQGADAFCASMLDEVAWLYNIRGSDVKCNPVVISYAVITTDGAHLFCDRRKLGSAALAHLAGEDSSDEKSQSPAPGKRMRDVASVAAPIHIHPY
jgi:hypothetical protein